jgi:hypothetical protein
MIPSTREVSSCLYRSAEPVSSRRARIATLGPATGLRADGGGLRTTRTESRTAGRENRAAALRLLDRLRQHFEYDYQFVYRP